MGIFLDSRNPYENFKEIVSDKYFVDKSMLIQELIPSIGKRDRYICITRPRRFGKTIMANMVGAFFGKAADSHHLFDHLDIAFGEDGKENPDYRRHLNQHHVIYIDFSKVPRQCTGYLQYIDRIQNGINKDLAEAYPEFDIHIDGATWDIMTDIFQKTGQRFLFIMDEWDALFYMSFCTPEDHEAYLLFLKALLKDNVYVELTYMTGILPIAKYSDGSELNMFLEYNMATSERFSEYFGFSDSEVDRLFDIYQKTTKAPRISRDDLTSWYDGYHIASGGRLYNPRSIVCAFTDNQLRNYWTSSGTYDSVFNFIKGNIDDIQNDLALLFAGEAIPADIQEYAAVSMHLSTKDEIYSAMVVYGLLTYANGSVFIPNKELMDSYASMMKKEQSLGYIHELANASRKMLEATLNKDTETMSEILQFAHDTESPVLSYNNETELAAVINLVYLSARDQYRVEREEKAGKGFVDFIFYPERRDSAAFILELKVDSTPETAIQQIKEKNYALRFRGSLGGNSKYTGKIFGIGISYDKKTNKHSCKIEEL